MLDARQSLRIFISSPGDVIEERDQARKVIEGLEQQYPGVTLQPVLWEELALPATASFQESIDFLLKQKPIDVAVFILWSRLGTPLGPAVTRSDGTPYRSGTEWEFDLMLASFDRSGRKRPVILAYTRDDYAGFQHKLAAAPDNELEALIAQRRLAEQFIREQFTDAEGHNVRANYTYHEPISFAKRLRVHLRQVLDELLGTDTGSWPDEPYRALDRFEVEHARIFCGRYEETSELIERLRDQQKAGCAFAAIIGASGSGKSSLARAGVAATLLQHGDDSSVRQWRAVFFLPAVEADDLLLHLTRSVAQAVPELGNSESLLAGIADGLRRDAPLTVQLSVIPALGRAAETAGGTVRLLVVLDQMEEMWTDRRITPENREQFLHCIEELARSGKVSVLATLRSDFYSHAQQLPCFVRLKGERGHFDLLPPDTAALRRIIAEPARLAGLTFERDEQTGRTLDELMLQDATRDPGALPLLQYALTELYRQRNREHRLLTFAAYQAMGGVEGALGRRADELFNQLPSDSRAALAEILPMLVTVDVGGEQAAVRRRAPKSDLMAIPQRAELTENLIDGRFLTTDWQQGIAVVSLAHEALLRRWSQITNWIAANRDQLRMRARVEQNHERWQQQGRDNSLLLQPGLPLEEARTLLNAAPHLLLPATADYIRASIALDEQHIRHARRRRRLVTSALSALTLLAIIAAAYAWTRQREANQRRDEAVNAKNDAVTARNDAVAAKNRAVKLADDNAKLATTEKQSRQLADEQSKLALDTLKSVVFDIQSKLEGVPAAEQVRQTLLNTAISGLEKVAHNLGNASQADWPLLVSHGNLGDTFLMVGAGRNSSATELAKQQFEISREIAARMVASNPKDSQASHALGAAYQRLGQVNLKLGDTLTAQGDFQQDLKITQQLAAAEPHDLQLQIDLHAAYDLVGEVSAQLHDTEAARTEYQQGLKLAQSQATAHPQNIAIQRDLASSFGELGGISIELGDVAAAANYYQQELKIRQQLAGARPQDAYAQTELAAAYDRVGRLKLRTNDLRAAQGNFQLMLQMDKRFAAADPQNAIVQGQLMNAYEMLGHANLHLGDLVTARDDFQQQFKIAQALAVTDPHNVSFQLDVAVAHEMLGNLSLQSGSTTAAQNEYQQSVEILKRLVSTDPHDGEAKRDLSVMYAKLGAVNLQRGNSAAARDSETQSVEIRRDLAAADPHNAQLQQDLASSYEISGDMSMHLGDMTAARDSYQKSVNVAQQLAAADPANAQLKTDLSRYYSDVGLAALRFGDTAGAQNAYQQSVNVANQLLSANPHNTDALHDLTAAYDGLADVSLRRGDASNARNYSQQTLTISKQLAAGSPQNAALQNSLATAYDKLGSAILQLGDARAALDDDQQGLKIRRQLAAGDPNDVFAQRNLFLSYQNVGEASQQSGDASAAREYFKQSLKIASRLVSADQSDAIVKGDLESAFYQLADISLEFGDTATARDDFAQYLKLSLALAQAAPHNPAAQRELANAYNVVGFANIEMRNFPAARDIYLKYLKICQQLAVAEPQSVDAQCNFGDSFNEQGFLEKAAGDFATAATWFKRAAGVLGPLNQSGGLASQPRYQHWLKISQWQLQLCSSTPSAIADLQFVLKQPSDMVSELLAIRGRALAHAEKTSEAVATAQKLTTLYAKDGEALYWSAGIYAICSAAGTGKPSTAAPPRQSPTPFAALAIDLLGQSQNYGYFKASRHVIDLQFNPDFETLRGRDDFKRFLSTILENGKVNTTSTAQ